MACFNYNGLSKSSGVYVIFNNHNWRIYVGSAKQFFKRWNDGHYKSLLANRHSNKFLQADFDKCKRVLGHDDFLEFHILEHMPNSTREERLVVEEKWIRVHFDDGRQCYNLCDRAISREDAKNQKFRSDKGSKRGPRSEETKKRISDATKGKQKPPLSASHREKLIAANTGKIRVFSEEHKQKISDANKNKKRSSEQRQRMSEEMFRRWQERKRT